MYQIELNKNLNFTLGKHILYAEKDKTKATISLFKKICLQDLKQVSFYLLRSMVWKMYQLSIITRRLHKNNHKTQVS